jgi:hypothetical protein
MHARCQRSCIRAHYRPLTCAYPFTLSSLISSGGTTVAERSASCAVALALCSSHLHTGRYPTRSDAGTVRAHASKGSTAAHRPLVGSCILGDRASVKRRGPAGSGLQAARSWMQDSRGLSAQPEPPQRTGASPPPESLHSSLVGAGKAEWQSLLRSKPQVPTVQDFSWTVQPASQPTA